jgi:hypothetical protein
MSVAQRKKRVGLNLPVEVRGRDEAGGRFTELTRSVNVSGGGILFESHHPVAVGDRLTLAIEVPLSLRRHFGDRDVYQARAVVCRVEPGAVPGPRRVGARFLGAADPDSK